jgi:hypothetical protein
MCSRAFANSSHDFSGSGNALDDVTLQIVDMIGAASQRHLHGAQARSRRNVAFFSHSRGSNRRHQWGSLSLGGRFGPRWGRDRAILQSIQEIEKPIRHWLGNDIGVKAA